MPVVMVGPDGQSVEVADKDIAAYAAKRYTIESSDQRLDRVAEDAREEKFGGVKGAAIAGGTAALSAVTAGGTDALFRATGGADNLREYRERNPIPSVVGTIAGSVVPSGAVGRAGAAARKTFAVGKDAGIAASVARTAAAGAVEGVVSGFQQGVSELALSADPLTLEHAVSTLSSNALFGGAVGGAAGGLGKLAEKGLARAKVGIDDYLARQGAEAKVADDLVGASDDVLKKLDADEVTRITTERTAEQAAIVDDLRAFRNELAESKPWLATKGGADREVREIGAMSAQADRSIRKMLNNPKALADSPRSVLKALQAQEYAYESLAAKADDIRAAVQAERAVAGTADDVVSSRLTALDGVAPALERNRAIQARVNAVLGDVASPRRAEIAAAMEANVAREAAAKEAKGSMAAQMLGGSVFSAAAGLASSIPVLGGLIAPMIGARASKAATNLVFGRLGNAAQAAAKRTGQAVDMFLGAASTAQKVAPVLATKVLGAVRYAPADGKAKDGDRDSKPDKLPSLYKARAAELRTQVMPDGMGGVVMRPEARERVAQMLGGVRMADPVMADRMETIAARRIEFLASKLPKRPDLPTPPGGADLWQPSELQMREFARFAAAVEDPGGVEERLASGAITPEDTEAYKAVYPERFAAMQVSLMEKLPQLRATLPYQKRIALSIFSGVPVDPAMAPNVLAVLQGSFAAEEGSEGGLEAPRAQPQFGSVTKPTGTPSQERAA